MFGLPIIVANITAPGALAISGLATAYWVVDARASFYELWGRSLVLLIDTLTFSMTPREVPHFAGAFYEMSTMVPISGYAPLLLALVVGKGALTAARGRLIPAAMSLENTSIGRVRMPMNEAASRRL